MVLRETNEPVKSLVFSPSLGKAGEGSRPEAHSSMLNPRLARAENSGTASHYKFFRLCYPAFRGMVENSLRPIPSWSVSLRHLVEANFVASEAVANL